MKRYMMILAAFAVFTSMSFAQDGGALYKTKCAMCHGAAGEGKVGPSLQKTALTAPQITALLSKGDATKKAPHNKPINGLSADQASQIGTFVMSLKK